MRLAALEPGATPVSRIRNFSIIAHIDHGKSTLADRLLEATGTIKKEDMKAQLLDSLDIERERGITIKLNTARMLAHHDESGEEYVLNLIDTPGHVDFTYEVSRSLAACEGALLVVDASQGVEAQTIANVNLAIENDLEIIPVLNKVDLPAADVERVAQEIEEVIGIDCSDALHCSAKTGLGVPAILQAIIDRVPAPQKREDDLPLRMLIYDSFYDQYRGAIALFRVVDGTVKKGMTVRFMASGKEYPIDEIGYTLGSQRVPAQSMSEGEVGYLVCSIKNIADAKVGDTIMNAADKDKKVQPLPGYAEAMPMVFCGLFPGDAGNYTPLKNAMERMGLEDAAISYEYENSQALGLGFRCGFLGVLHMEVIKDRLEREYGLDLMVTSPSVKYQISLKDGTEMTIQYANELPAVQKIKEIREPYALVELICPEEFVGACMELAIERRSIYKATHFLGQNRVLLEYETPMAELIRDFFDQLKSRSRGYASLDYRLMDFRSGDLVKLDVDINKVTAHPLSMIVHRSRALRQGRKMAQVLKQEIPPQMIIVFIQARIGTQIVAAEKIAAVRKDVLAKCYGGDVTRKMKLLKKQAEGKKKMQAIGKVNVPSSAIMAVIKGV